MKTRHHHKLCVLCKWDPIETASKIIHSLRPMARTSTSTVTAKSLQYYPIRKDPSSSPISLEHFHSVCIGGGPLEGITIRTISIVYFRLFFQDQRPNYWLISLKSANNGSIDDYDVDNKRTAKNEQINTQRASKRMMECVIVCGGHVNRRCVHL